MRRPIILAALTLLAACAPPHPTHPTRIGCRLNVVTRFSASVDRTSPGTIQEGPDPCQGGGPVLPSLSSWEQRGDVIVEICAASGTGPEQAATLCSQHLAATGRNSGDPAPPLAAGRPPEGGRICPGSLSVVSSQILGGGGAAALHPNECREGTTLPLVP